MAGSTISMELNCTDKFGDVLCGILDSATNSIGSISGARKTKTKNKI